MIAKFIREYRSFYFSYIVLATSFILLFFLYQLPTEFLQNALLLSLTLLILLTVGLFWKFRNRMRALEDYVHEEALPLLNKPVDLAYLNLIEAEKEATREQLLVYKSREEDLQAMVKMWSHQMKVPLAALSLMSQTDNLNQQDVNHQLLRLDNYMANLLNYLKLTNHASDFRFEQVEVREVVVDLVKKYRNQFLQKDISVTIDGNWLLKSDRKWLSFALSQIIDNALKYNKTGGKVAIELNEGISISDTGSVTKADLITPYAQDLVGKIRTACGGQEKPLTGLNIIVDAGNGAGGFFAEKVLAELGADTTGSQFLDPDGTFPNHVPNPDNKEAMESIRQAVLKQGADLGIIFDTDVDRAALVTKSGEILNRNNLIAVLSQIVLAEHPGTSIVTNSPTTEHLKVFIESLGGKQIRYISGYRNVINRAILANQEGVDCQLAIETSGHAAFKENYFLDDGTYVAAKILMLLPKLQAEGKSLDDLIAQLKQPLETQEVRFKLEAAGYRALGEQVIADFRNTSLEGFAFNPENEEGVRFDLTELYGDGWLLLRMSLHEPLLVLQVENDQTGHIPAVLRTLSAFLDQYPAVNQEKLKALI